MTALKKLTLIFPLIISLSSAISQTPEKSSSNIFANNSAPFKSDFLKISATIFIAEPEYISRISWKTSENQQTDYFDAYSGASIKHSTKALKGIMFKKDEKYLPKGLFALLSFAFSDPQSIQSDKLTITRNEKDSRQLEITFTHRGIDYKIVTDKKGYVSPQEGFFIRQNQNENQSEYEKDVPTELPEGTTEGMLNDENNFIYAGKLKIKYSYFDVLTVKGKLKKQKRIIKQNNKIPDEKIDEPENQETDKDGAPLLNPYLD